MSWLLDTCVLSEWVQRVPQAAVIAWLGAQDEARLFISQRMRKRRAAPKFSHPPRGA